MKLSILLCRSRLEEGEMPKVKQNPKVTFSITSVVRVEVSGEKDPRGELYSRHDGGLVVRLNHFLLENRIFPAVRGSAGGPGYYCAHYTAEDAAKIEAWLREQGAVMKG